MAVTRRQRRRARPSPAFAAAGCQLADQRIGLDRRRKPAGAAGLYLVYRAKTSEFANVEQGLAAKKAARPQ